MKISNKKQRGGISLIGILVLGFIVILVLSYFRISIRSVVESPEGQDNINYVAGAGTNIWDQYLSEPAHYLWNDVFIDIFWNPFLDNMRNIRDGHFTDYEANAPSVQINNSPDVEEQN